ncbi:putative disease resistance protein RGA3 [Trifolium pratense]|uniref:putative disease resistance protein RGA3 n=1 Tax=Trifolium pratense TaxID=57577 RepID=UPI001E6950B7|nr:putative disease resistance protein RGA3 [Trifolium pratense]
MAESLLFSLAESFIGKVASRAVEEASLAFGVYDHLLDIKNKASLIKAVLLDAEQKQRKNHLLREWLQQIKCVFNDAEDVIDDFECEALRKHVVNTSGSIGRKVRRYCSSSNPLVYRLKMAHKIKDIKERFIEVAADRLNFGLQINESDNRVVQRREMTHFHVNESNVIGREHDKQQIIDLLLQDDGDKSLSVIPIVGIGGLGKTTLAKCVFNDKSVVDSFPLKMWVCVSDDFELKHLLIKILNSASASNSNQENFDVDQLQSHLRNKLFGQKFLLVLDDVWNKDRAKWEELKDIIQGVAGTEGSKVLVTTRSHNVADVMRTTSPHILKDLSEKDSLSVFVKWAFKDGEAEKYTELVEIGKEIVQKCGGLPLALRTLGSSLFKKVDIKDWEFVRDNEIWNLPQKEDDILPAIKLSYDQLPSYLKSCFACFSLFEKDFVFSNFHVTELWAALGFLPSPKKGQTIDDIVNQLLHDLMSISFLQDFVDFGNNACIFKLHDLVHDLALYVAKDEFQLVKLHNKKIFENVLHLSFIENDLLGQTSVPTRLRTILFPIGANNKAFLYTLVSRCKFLRILQITNSTYVSLPQSIGKLKHLRCLNLEFNKELKSLPNSVCKLQNLHILKLNGCTNLQTLPNGIGNLISLRQLHITTMQSNFPDKEIAKLTSLEFISVSSCDYLESLFEGIQLPNLKMLMVISCGNLKSLPFHAIPNLESLGIDSCNKIKFSLNHEYDISNLKLKLLGLGSLPQLVSFPQWLQGCVTTLQSLELCNCCNLEELPEWLSTLICLKAIEILECPKLVSLPDNLHQLKNLEYLYIEGCDELCRRYHPKVGKDWHKISHIKQVIIKSPELED